MRIQPLHPLLGAASSIFACFQQCQEVARCEDAYALVFAHVQKVTVTSDDVRAFCFDGSRQDVVIVGIGGDDIQEEMTWSNFGEVTKNVEVILDVLFVQQVLVGYVGTAQDVT